MNSSKPRYLQVLEATSYIAIIAICGTLLYQQVFPETPSHQADIPMIEVGDQHSALAELVPKGQDQALVFAVSPDCHFCEKSMPFYQKLVQERAARGAGLPLIAAIGEHTALQREQEVFAQHQVEPDTLVQLDTRSLNINSVPTLLLVDREGKVTELWRGYQDEQGQSEIIEELL